MINSRLFCKHCQYQLGGLTRNVCPECGMPFNPTCRRSFSRHPRLRRWRRTIGATLLVPSLLYVVSYYCVVQVRQLTTFRGALVVTTVSGQPKVILALEPTYRFGGAIASSIYRPLHTLDRKLRPDTWSIPVTLQTLQPMQQAGQSNKFLWAGM